MTIAKEYVTAFFSIHFYFPLHSIKQITVSGFFLHIYYNLSCLATLLRLLDRVQFFSLVYTPEVKIYSMDQSMNLIWGHWLTGTCYILVLPFKGTREGASFFSWKILLSSSARRRRRGSKQGIRKELQYNNDHDNKRPQSCYLLFLKKELTSTKGQCFFPQQDSYMMLLLLFFFLVVHCVWGWKGKTLWKWMDKRQLSSHSSCSYLYLL